MQNRTILSKAWARRLKTMYKVERLVCCRCGRVVRVGSRVHVQSQHHALQPSTGRIYHRRCWRRLFF